YNAVPEKIQVVYSGVSPTLLELNTHRNRNSKLKIISVGRFHWKKGYNYAIEACQILRRKGLDFEYIIVAAGDAEEAVFHISDLSLQNFIKIIPGLPHDKVFEAIADADLFLLPSVEEGIANVVLESMALGTPVISTDC